MSGPGTVVGRVARLARYPVKSLQGETLDRAAFGPNGITGDRGLGVVAVDSGQVLSAKSEPRLLDASARTSATTVEVRLPGAPDWVSAPSTGLDEAMSLWLGRPVRVEAPPTGDPRSYNMTFNIDDESADRFDWPCPPGTFFDVAAVHLLTTASMRAASQHHPEGAWEVDRFRPTVLVEAAGDDFVDDQWLGGRLRFGTVEVTIDDPTIRCAVPTRAQGDLPRDIEILKTVNREHGGTLGLYCSMSVPGEVAVGDEVVFLPGA